MAYVLADTAPKVGFRPYLETEPYGASHLSGLGQRHPFKTRAWQLRGVFDPERLRGLGQVAPFPLPPSADPRIEAANELWEQGILTREQHDAIVSGESSFEDFGLKDPTQQESWFDLVDLFREANQAIGGVEQQLRDAAAEIVRQVQAGERTGTADPTLAAMAQDALAKRQQYNGLAAEFIDMYRAATGTVPSGLAGLGIAVFAWIAGAAIFLVTTTIALYALIDWSKSIDVAATVAQTQRIQAESGKLEAQSNQQLVQLLADAQKRGDTVGVRTYSDLLSKRGIVIPVSEDQQVAKEDFLPWIQKNAKWIGLAAVGLVVAGPMAQGLFGGRRR